MRISRMISVVALLAVIRIAAFAQPQASSFAPFDRWSAAVLAGNQASLAALYTSNPPSQNQTPAGKSQNPAEEPMFWSALAGQGLSDFQPKVLSISRPQPGEVALVLRIEFKLKTSSGAQPFTVEGAQVWIQQGADWRVAADAAKRPDSQPELSACRCPQSQYTSLYPPPEKAEEEIRAALVSAAKDHKRVILVFGANWCYDCHVLDATFHSKNFAAVVNASYHVVHVNVGDDGDKNLDLAEKYGVPLKKAVRIPSLAVLEPDGKVVYSQKNGEFDNSVRIGPADVAAFLKKWAPPHA